MHTLGDIQFTGFMQPQGMDMSHEATYAEHAKLQGKPALQRTGSKNDTVSMTIGFHNSFCIPEVEIEKLRRHLEDGTIMPLGTQAGDALGDYVIQPMQVTRTHSSPDGSIINASVSLTLLEWASVDGTAERKLAARQAGFAVSSNNPPGTTAPQLTNQVEREAIDSVTATASSSNAIDTSLIKATVDADTTAHERIVVERRLNDIVADANSARGTINAFTGDRYTATRQLDTDLLAVVGSANSMLAVVQTASVADLRTMLTTLSGLIDTMRRSAQILSQYATGR